MIAGIVMAAGLSRRFTKGDKLLSVIEGESLAQRTARIVLESNLDAVSFVYSSNGVLDMINIGIEQISIKRKKEIYLLENKSPDLGQSESIKIGLLPFLEDDTIDGVMFLTSDQPGIGISTIDGIISEFNSKKNKNAIIVPSSSGKRGSPVLFGRAYFKELSTLTGDMGGRVIINANQEHVSYIEVEESELFDIDTWEALIEFQKRK